MTDNMIERVARALWATGCEDPEETPWEWLLSRSDRAAAAAVADYRNAARAAIEAMREPTAAMMLAANATPGGVSDLELWRAMVDAALAED